MAYTALNTIKNWFKTGLKPTQTQFWATWDSFWHKSEQIPVNTIEGLQGFLDQKMNNQTFAPVATTGDYSDLVNAPLFISVFGKKHLLEKHPNNAQAVLEVNDMIANAMPPDDNNQKTIIWPLAIYKGGVVDDPASWLNINIIEDVPYFNSNPNPNPL